MYITEQINKCNLLSSFFFFLSKWFHEPFYIGKPVRGLIIAINKISLSNNNWSCITPCLKVSSSECSYLLC